MRRNAWFIVFPFLDQLVLDVFLRNRPKRICGIEAGGQLGAFPLNAGVDTVTRLAASIITPLTGLLG